MGTKQSKTASKSAPEMVGNLKLPEESKQLDPQEAYNEAKENFREGNRLFRESKFDLAKDEYAKA
jgi:hypothetical protein